MIIFSEKHGKCHPMTKKTWLCQQSKRTSFNSFKTSKDGFLNVSSQQQLWSSISLGGGLGLVMKPFSQIRFLHFCENQIKCLHFYENQVNFFYGLTPPDPLDILNISEVNRFPSVSYSRRRFRRWCSPLYKSSREGFRKSIVKDISSCAPKPVEVIFYQYRISVCLSSPTHSLPGTKSQWTQALYPCIGYFPHLTVTDLIPTLAGLSGNVIKTCQGCFVKML